MDEIKRVISFPKLEMPPADFLQNMEDYAKQAPRQFDDSGPKKVSLCLWKHNQISRVLWKQWQ